MKSWLLSGLVTGFAAIVQAALPEAVVQACLAPSITEHVSGQTWQLMTADSWDRGAMRVTETAEGTITSQTTAPHPQGWAETEVAILQSHDSLERPSLEQTLTLTMKAKGIVPKLEATLIFLNQAHLPPCSVTTWQGKLALVAKEKDWYIIADDPAITITQTDEARPRTSIRLPKLTLEKLTSASAAIRVGEGALP
ncbi:MAG: hypothetical protein IJV69_03905 [Kiritimatiellae bacterium]|nr:hypothetical protein [Kiritimatiellia bacterium]